MEKEEKRGGTWTNALIGAAVAGAGFYAFENWDSVSTRYFGFPYNCKNMTSELVEISAKNGNPMLPRLIGVIDGEATSESPTRTECRGTGVFSTGAKAPINYRAYEAGGQWWLSFEPAV